MGKGQIAFLGMAVLLLTAGPGFSDQPVEKKLPSFQTPYYTLHSDANIEVIREAYVRVTAMAEEYSRRVRDFGAIRSRLPIYIYTNDDDYFKAGGMTASGGCFTGDKLLIRGGKNGCSWGTVQHEAFHQFAAATISTKLPVWVNEGLAEYFGAGIWTGDNLITGLIQSGRLKYLKKMIEANEILPFSDMLTMSGSLWAREMLPRNYTEAWSMVHFLIHGEDGKYCDAFTKYLKDVSQGKSSDTAFAARFGNNTKAFQQRYCAWWQAQDDAGTMDLFNLAKFETLTSLLARGTWLKITFDDGKEFLAACKDGKIAIDGAKAPRLWLPPSLVSSVVADAPKLGKLTIDNSAANQPKLILTVRDGTVITGTFALAAKGEPSCEVKVVVTPPKTATSKP